MSDNIISVGHLMEDGYTVIHWIPSRAKEEGFSLNDVPLYDGTITTPLGQTMIVMEHAQQTWYLPLPSTNRSTKSTTLIIDSGNSFNLLMEIDNVDDKG